MRYRLDAEQHRARLDRSLWTRLHLLKNSISRHLSSLATRDGLARLIVVYTSGNALSLLMRMAGGILVARLTGPAVLGLFNGLALVLGYVPFLQMGVINGLNRELPYYVGMGEIDQARQMVAVAELWSILLGGVLALGMAAVALWYFERGNNMLAAGWLTQGLGAFSLVYAQHYLQATYRCRGDFEKLTVVTVVQNALGIVLVVFVWLYGFYGLCYRSVMMAAASLYMFWIRRPVRVRPSWNGCLFRQLVRVGLPILLAGQIYAWWAVLDSTLVLYYLKAEGLGNYQLAVIVGSSLILLPTAVSQVIYPRMAEQFGKASTIRGLIEYVKLPTLYLTIFSALCLLMAWFAIPYLTLWLLPKYARGIHAAQWTLVAVFLTCLTPVNNVFNVVKRQDLYVAAIVVGMALYAAAVFWFARHGAHLVQFAQAMALGRATFIGLSYLFLALLCRRERLHTIGGA